MPQEEFIKMNKKEKKYNRYHALLDKYRYEVWPNGHRVQRVIYAVEFFPSIKDIQYMLSKRLISGDIKSIYKKNYAGKNGFRKLQRLTRIVV